MYNGKNSEYPARIFRGIIRPLFARRLLRRWNLHLAILSDIAGLADIGRQSVVGGDTIIHKEEMEKYSSLVSDPASYGLSVSRLSTPILE